MVGRHVYVIYCVTHKTGYLNCYIESAPTGVSNRVHQNLCVTGEYRGNKITDIGIELSLCLTN
jgi:hypothetical protein